MELTEVGDFGVGGGRFPARLPAVRQLCFDMRDNRCNHRQALMRPYLSWIEGLTTNQYVEGSNPPGRTIQLLRAGHPPARFIMSGRSRRRAMAKNGISVGRTGGLRLKITCVMWGHEASPAPRNSKSPLTYSDSSQTCPKSCQKMYEMGDLCPTGPCPRMLLQLGLQLSGARFPGLLAHFVLFLSSRPRGLSQRAPSRHTPRPRALRFPDLRPRAHRRRCA